MAPNQLFLDILPITNVVHLRKIGDLPVLLFFPLRKIHFYIVFLMRIELKLKTNKEAKWMEAGTIWSYSDK